ncbi:gamma-glutamylcyclotransferase family protein [Devosia soli]|uniref:gamma-glutamylcyclotransferase family protein n=1 Tax=Devosia soli TaxID=361041 RepID=UPI00069C928B|nr:gamma-glutamylcyclotransferase family protein [Devosia soli]
MTQHAHYFAYGSNMDVAQMQVRCPGAEVVGIGVLADHMLCFPRHSISRDCGVASVTPRPGWKTLGVVYRLSADNIARLDAYEDFVAGRAAELNSYNRVEIEVFVNGRPSLAQIYIAVAQDGAFRPNAAYLRHLLDGASMHRLPADYVAQLHGWSQSSMLPLGDGEPQDGTKFGRPSSTSRA